MAKWKEPDQSPKQCPLGEDCDLTIAWMLGRESAKDEIAALKAELEKMRASYGVVPSSLTTPKKKPDPWKDV